MNQAPKTELATFAAGCFWGVQEILRKIPGVIRSEAGYVGGSVSRPTYEDVCSGETGHAEAVQVEFDPSRVSYEVLLSYFWRLHDPTTLNQQGPDFGTQYRSAIFFHSEEQRKAAEHSKEAFDQSKVFDSPAVTEIVPASEFYKAEEYHQHYFMKNSRQVCHILRDR